jgi:multicomponent K+:H+ antiporter subunit E
MRRFLPTPLLSIALLALWLLLHTSMDAGTVLLGAVVALVTPYMTAALRPVPVRVRRPGTIARLLLHTLADVIASNGRVARRIVMGGKRAPRPAFVHLPLELTNPNGLAVLAMITTFVPGTVWSELALDRGTLMVHVFDLDDEAEFIAHFKERYERPLMEIFE